MPRMLVLTGRDLAFDDLRALLEDRSVRLKVDPAARRVLARSRAKVDRALRDGATIYGVNTGFGKLSDRRIDGDHLADLQKNLVRSHAVGTGPALRSPGLFIALRANALLRGQSGVSPEMIDHLVGMFNRRADVRIPTEGSVGASGDLAPLAELGCAMLDGGYSFKPKEALSLINGTQLMSALLVEALALADDLFKLADVAGAMSLEALKGSVKPFDPRVHAARPHPGQGAVAGNFRRLLKSSEVMESHRNCTKVQDAYSLRCIPQVHGAARDAAEFARRVLLVEVNSATDNPLVFEDGSIVSAGNFHGQPVAQAADFLAIAAASVANISERRVDRMTNPDLSELPAFLIKGSGLNSGFMMVQVAAAAAAAECRVDAGPASVHSIPTGASKEDHVSMGPLAARKALRVLGSLRRVLAMEILCAAQGLDFLRPLRPGAGVAAAHREVRRRVPFLDRDRYMRPLLRKMDAALERVLPAVERAVGRLA